MCRRFRIELRWVGREGEWPREGPGQFEVGHKAIRHRLTAGGENPFAGGNKGIRRLLYYVLRMKHRHSK